jgi:prepilin-type N-terminal cleavage/methylation domain-containing protein
MAHVDKKAFTLVELMIVVLILGVLATVAVPRIVSAVHNSKIKACRTNVNLINRQAEKFFSDKGHWPANWNNFKGRPQYFANDPPVCPFGINYIMSNETHRVAHHNH